MNVTSKLLAVDCQYKEKTYTFYVQQCSVRGLEALTERDYITLGNNCDV